MLFGPGLWQGSDFRSQMWSLAILPFSLSGQPFLREVNLLSLVLCPQCLYKVAASFPASTEVPLRTGVFQRQVLGKFEPRPSKSWDSFNTHKVVFIHCCPFCLLPDLWVAAQWSCTKYCKNVFNIHATIWFLGEIPNIVSISIKAF